MKSLSFAKPYMLVVVGIPGAGKSFFSEHFAGTFSAPYISFDRLRDDLYNDPTHSNDEYIILTRVAMHMLDEIIKTKKTVLVEGLGATKTERKELAKKARSVGYEPLFIWVQTEPQTAKQRSVRGVRGSTSHNRLKPEIYERLAKRFTPLSKDENSIVISGKHTYATQAKIVLKKLTQTRASIAGHSSPPIRSATPKGRGIKVR